MSDPLDESRPSQTHDSVEEQMAEIQRQLAEMQEDHQLYNVNDAAKREEGQRKSASGPAGAAGAAAARNTSIFVGNMDPKTTEGDLRIFFAQCGAIRRVTMIKDKFTGMPKGIAYVEFEAEEGASAAVLKTNQPCHGKPLKIDMKRDNIPAGQRGGGPAAGAPFRGAAPGGFMPRGRGGPAAMMQQQQMAMAAAAMMMMGGGAGFSPYGAPRGRGRGRGRPY
jgi:polyadenylate-binding protein 2